MVFEDESFSSKSLAESREFSFPVNEAKSRYCGNLFSEEDNSAPSLKINPGRESAHFLHTIQLRAVALL